MHTTHTDHTETRRERRDAGDEMTKMRSSIRDAQHTHLVELGCNISHSQRRAGRYCAFLFMIAHLFDSSCSNPSFSPVPSNRHLSLKLSHLSPLRQLPIHHPPPNFTLTRWPNTDQHCREPIMIMLSFANLPLLPLSQLPTLRTPLIKFLKILCLVGFPHLSCMCIC